MKKIILAFLIIIPFLSACMPPPKKPADAPDPVEVFAVLAEKDSYNGLNMENLLVD